MSATWPLQKALIPKVRADGLFSAMARIYGMAAPSNAVFPYVTMGTATEESRFSFGSKAHSRNSDVLHIWSKVSEGEVKQVYGHLKRVLNGQTLVCEGYMVRLARLTLVSVVREPDGVTYHGVVRYDTEPRVTA